MNSSDTYPLDMASRTHLKAIDTKIMATETPKLWSQMMPCLDFRHFMNEYIKNLKFGRVVF
jgi:hypothetical protein